MKIYFDYRFTLIRKILYGLLAFVCGSIILTRFFVNQSPKVVLELVVWNEQNESVHIGLQLEPWHPDTHFVWIPPESPAKQSAIREMSNFIDTMIARAETNTLIIVSLSQSCTYGDLVAVLDLFEIRHLDYVRSGRNYCARLAIRDTTINYKYPL